MASGSGTDANPSGDPYLDLSDLTRDQTAALPGE
jgi:hypothetical protein